MTWCLHIPCLEAKGMLSSIFDDEDNMAKCDLLVSHGLRAN